MQKTACGNFRYWEIWGAISVSGEARTNWTDPGSWGILWGSLLTGFIEWNAEIPCRIVTARRISVPFRFPNSGRVGAPTVPGRSRPIGLSFGHILEDIKCYSTPLLWPDWTMSSYRKRVAKIFVIGRFGALFLDLEMPELDAGTQGAGGYCKEVYQWIL